ncbi:uncharacterized protein [Pocillopora verrucosa]|uniref:uncharacterized protein n=1 Tax=Pocillopora verrucosa TaxID=203993 RepID=UPI00333EDB39
MKLLLFLTLCMTIVFVAAEPSFVEDEYLEDAEENYARHHLRRCQKNEDCKAGECCRLYWYWFWKRRCFKQRTENQTCLLKTSSGNCHYGCADGLECVKCGDPDFRHPHHYNWGKCIRPLPPTEEPGSGDVDD